MFGLDYTEKLSVKRLLGTEKLAESVTIGIGVAFVQSGVETIALTLPPTFTGITRLAGLALLLRLSIWWYSKQSA